MVSADEVFSLLLDELKETNKCFDRIANASEGIFSVLMGNEEAGLDGVLPVLLRLEKALGPVGEYCQHLLDKAGLEDEEDDDEP
jgi:hypothetical protein